MSVDFLHSVEDLFFSSVSFFFGSQEVNFLPSNAGSESLAASNADAADDGSSFPIAGALEVLSTISTAVQSTVSELGMQEKMGLRELWGFGL